MSADGDSSSDDELEYATTNVLLGYASKEPTGDDVSYLGGTTSWLDNVRPSFDLVQCKVCHSMMAQILQLNSELPDHFPGHDRRLHVLACRRKACNRKPGSIRVLRATRHPSSPSAVPPTKAVATPAAAPGLGTLGSDIFGGSGPSASAVGANPFSKKTAASPSAGPNASLFGSTQTQPAKTAASPAASPAASAGKDYAAAARASAPPAEAASHKPWPSSPEVQPFPKLYLDADYEALDEPANPPVQAKEIMALEEEGGSGSGGSASLGKDEAEAFESSLDKAFQRFADRLAHNPTQVLRYEFRGSPLLYSDSDEVGKLFASSSTGRKIGTTTKGMPRCQNCGRPRVFEMQVTPHAILELEADEAGIDGMEWGTLLVGVCEADCQARGVGRGEVGYLDEWVGVQWEEEKKA